MPPPKTYMAIPPPPLPEFYLPRRTTYHTGSSTSSSGHGIEAGRETAKQADFGDGTDERFEHTRIASRATKIPPRPPITEHDDVPPLEVYHICRICLKPRSSRYHREHPIPVDGVPPPPGICRRCRVVSVDDSKTVIEVVEKKESQPVKLGIKCLVPEGDYYSNDEMRHERANYLLSHAEWQEVEPRPREKRSRSEAPRERTEVVYRHVHVAVPPPPPPPQLLPEPRVVRKSMGGDAIETVSSKAAPTHQRRRSSVVEQSTRQIRQEYREPMGPPPSSHTSRSAKSRRSSISHHTSVSAKAAKPGYTESDIRTLARDEVERYRQAERKIEAHKDPFAHGRLLPVEREPVHRIPVERRIDIERDVPEEMPWERRTVSPRRDSAFAMAGSQQGSRKAMETVSVRYSRDGQNEDDFVRRVSPPSSDTSSDKTKWPKDEVALKSQRQTSGRNTNMQLAKIHSERHTVHRSQQGKSECSQPRECEVVEVARRHGHTLERESTRTAETRPFRKTEVSVDRSDTRTLDRGRAVEETRAKSSTRQQRKETSLLETIHRPSVSQAIAAKREAPDDTPGKGRQLHAPYPHSGQKPAAIMPSPSTHRSSSIKQDDSRDPNREYYYVKRTVQPVSRAREAEDLDSYYKETTEYLHRRRAAPKDPEDSGQLVNNQPAKPRRPPSITSSRVRFSNKVDVSPTPPGSDASSSEFRNIGRVKGQLDGQDGDAAAEYERRGRLRSREPVQGYGRRYRQDAGSRQEYEFVAEGDVDRDPTLRPSHRQRRPSDNSEPSTVPSTVRYWARVQSESPSREKFHIEATRQGVDGTGPYAVESRQSTSVDVEDGSTLSGGSDDYHHQEQRKRNGRPGKF